MQSDLIYNEPTFQLSILGNYEINKNLTLLKSELFYEKGKVSFHLPVLSLLLFFNSHQIKQPSFSRKRRQPMQRTWLHLASSVQGPHSGCGKNPGQQPCWPRLFLLQQNVVVAVKGLGATSPRPSLDGQDVAMGRLPNSSTAVRQPHHCFCSVDRWP